MTFLVTASLELVRKYESLEVQVPLTPVATRPPFLFEKTTLSAWKPSIKVAPAFAASIRKVSVGPFLPAEEQPIMQ